MTETKTGRARTLVMLMGAVVATAAIVALFRYWWVASPSGQDWVGPVLGSFAIFVVGGAPVALLCWSLDGPLPEGASSFTRLRQVLIPNLLTALVGVLPIYLLVWHWPQVIALLVGLTFIGSVSLFAVLALRDLGERRRGQTDRARTDEQR